MVNFIQNLIGNDVLATVIMSFVPLIELKGGIVFARGAGLDLITSFLLAYVGSTLVFFPIYFLLRPILELMKKIKWFKTLAEKVENYFAKKAQQAIDKQSDKGSNKTRSALFLKQMGVFVFVAIPLPMTGIWTGTAIAVFLGLKFKEAILPAVLGNFVAGALISILAQICLTFFEIAVLDYVLYVLFALALVLLVVFIIKVMLSKDESKVEK